MKKRPEPKPVSPYMSVQEAAARPGGYSLYSLPAWELYGGRVPADYEVSGEGTVSTGGDAGARWSADELTFTGIEAQYPKAAGPV